MKRFLQPFSPYLQDKFLCRIRSLENLLTDERQRAQAAEKRLLMKDGQQSALTDDMKLHQREKEILLQEVTKLLDLLTYFLPAAYLIFSSLKHGRVSWNVRTTSKHKRPPVQVQIVNKM